MSLHANQSIRAYLRVVWNHFRRLHFNSTLLIASALRRPSQLFVEHPQIYCGSWCKTHVCERAWSRYGALLRARTGHVTLGASSLCILCTSVTIWDWGLRGIRGCPLHSGLPRKKLVKGVTGNFLHAFKYARACLYVYLHVWQVWTGKQD